MYIDAQGKVAQIKILQSAGNRELDAYAMAALIRRRARPAPPWQLDMRITFTMEGGSRRAGVPDYWNR